VSVAAPAATRLALPRLTPLRLVVGLACAVAAAFVAIPLIVLVTHTSPGALASALRDPVVLDALRVSLVTTAISLVLVVAVGTPLAVALARGRFPGRALLDALVGLPLVLPPVVAGLALLLAFSPSGPLGTALQPLGVRVPLTESAVVLAQTFVAGPFYVYAVTAGISGVDRAVEEVASTLGASPWHVFRTVTLPLVRPAVAYGLVLSGARALGEFGATITVAGNLQGRTQTMPTAIYVAFERDPDGAVALAVILAVVSFALLLGVRGLRLARAAV
jgi:molybdate transport system permease protein